MNQKNQTRSKITFARSATTFRTSVSQSLDAYMDRVKSALASLGTVSSASTRTRSALGASSNTISESKKYPSDRRTYVSVSRIVQRTCICGCSPFRLAAAEPHNPKACGHSIYSTILLTIRTDDANLGLLRLGYSWYYPTGRKECSIAVPCAVPCEDRKLFRYRMLLPRV